MELKRGLPEWLESGAEAVTGPAKWADIHHIVGIVVSADRKARKAFEQVLKSPVDQAEVRIYYYTDCHTGSWNAAVAETLQTRLVVLVKVVGKQMADRVVAILAPVWVLGAAHSGAGSQMVAAVVLVGEQLVVQLESVEVAEHVSQHLLGHCQHLRLQCCRSDPCFQIVQLLCLPHASLASLPLLAAPLSSAGNLLIVRALQYR